MLAGVHPVAAALAAGRRARTRLLVRSELLAFAAGRDVDRDIADPRGPDARGARPSGALAERRSVNKSCITGQGVRL